MKRRRTRGSFSWVRKKLLILSSVGAELIARYLQWWQDLWWVTLTIIINNSKIFPQVNQKKRLHLNASLSQYLLKEWQGVYPTSLLTGILHLLHLPIIRHLVFMIKCSTRQTTDEPPWLLESNGRATAGCWKRKGQLAWGRGEDHHISIKIVWWNLSSKVGRGRGRKRKASSASPPPPPLQPLQNDFAHGAISHSTHQDRYVQKKHHV